MIRSVIFIFLLMFLAMPAAAKDGKELPIILELFTAQSCPYCPQAEALLAEYIKLPRVIGYSCHVARTRSDMAVSYPFCARRQEYYERVLQTSGPYTPQMVVNGVAEVIGYNQKKIAAAAAMTIADIGQIKIKASTPTLFLLDMPAAKPEDYMIVVARIDKPVRATGRYAMGGKRVYHNLASQFSDDMKWEGKPGPVYMSLIRENNTKGFIVLAQKISTGKIVAAGQHLF